MKLNRPVCSFCGAKEGECDILLYAENDKTFICDQCVRVITALSKANPKAKRLLYPLKQGKK